MPYRNRTHKTRQQRQHRRAGHVRRIEVILSAKNERDHVISDFLDDLPRGAASEFIRQAIAEKIERETSPLPAQEMPEPDAHASDQIEMLFEELDHQRQTASEQIETIYQELADEKRNAGRQLEAMIAELAALRQIIHQPAPIAAPTAAVSPVPEPPTTLPEVSETVGAVVSRGIDMLRPRPRKPARKTMPTPPSAEEELSEQDQIRLAKILANSIKRAQPGRR